MFQSTPSLRRATVVESVNGFLLAVSIHALLAESDLQHLQAARRPFEFQSTPSLRRATIGFVDGR